MTQEQFQKALEAQNQLMEHYQQFLKNIKELQIPGEEFCNLFMSSVIGPEEDGNMVLLGGMPNDLAETLLSAMFRNHTLANVVKTAYFSYLGCNADLIMPDVAELIKIKGTIDNNPEVYQEKRKELAKYLGSFRPMEDARENPGD